jgi:hypothetical protein
VEKHETIKTKVVPPKIGGETLLKSLLVASSTSLTSPTPHHDEEGVVHL